MAGDSNLTTYHEGRSLLLWLRWFVRARWMASVALISCGYAVSRLLHFSFDLRLICCVSLASLAMNAVTAHVVRDDALAEQRTKLHWVTSLVTLADVTILCLGIHFAGGAIGPLWPFPFIPVVLGAALLPSVRVLIFHSVWAILITVVSARAHEPSQVLAVVMLSGLFLGFGGVLVFGLARGVRQQRSVARELDRARNDQQLAEAVARRREEILSVVSHELASPLMTLRGYVRLMQETKSHGGRNNQQLLDRVERQVARITSLADDLLEMASTKAGAMRLQRRPFDLVEALRELRENLRVQHPDALIAVEGEDRVLGVWDRNRLDQLFSNLVLNAIKFAGPRSHVTIVIERENVREVHVRVRDNGPGISKEALPRVFEPFQRYSSERGGLGLGLAIAKAVTELHDGRIWAESSDAEPGATIHVVLPTDSKPSGELPVVDSDPVMAVQT